MEFSREVFEAQRQPRFGKTNPERMHLAFCEWMIPGDGPPDADEEPGYSPYQVGTLFDVSIYDGEGPSWTFQRTGATRTELPDGRIVCVGGEHEDYYDPDFCIYNDVVVFLDGTVEIYDYREEEFPPTDFHTATSTGDRLILIGGIGYQGTRRFGATPVFALDLSTYRISEIATRGEVPG